MEYSIYNTIINDDEEVREAISRLLGSEED
jgi:hypothetical protein